MSLYFSFGIFVFSEDVILKNIAIKVHHYHFLSGSSSYFIVNYIFNDNLLILFEILPW